MAEIKIGQTAPDFTLFDSEKKKLTLGSFKKKNNVLLLFFPLAFTGVCTKELCAVRDEMSLYENDHVQVLGISVDSVFTLDRYKQDLGIGYPLLSDFNKEVSTLYNSIYDSFTDMEMQGVSKRSAFLIDREGIIQYAEVLENAGEMPDFNKIKEKIAVLAGNSLKSC